MTKETRKKISEKNKGHEVSENQRRQISEALAGTKLSEERKIKDRDSLRGLKKIKNTSSKYVGVIWDKSRNKWQARITVDKKMFHLERFDKEDDAARAYNEGALKYFGSNAKLNIIEDN